MGLSPRKTNDVRGCVSLPGLAAGAGVKRYLLSVMVIVVRRTMETTCLRCSHKNVVSLLIRYARLYE